MYTEQRALQIVQTLQKKGFVAYFVGGYVRDRVLCRLPKDIDIGTNATPDEVAALFPNHVPVGRDFGVILVTTPDGAYEVATFRSEAGYADKRRPDRVTWASAKEDTKRRDFTINGLLYDPVTEQTLDFVDGTRDLSLKIVRTIGQPDDRFTEDPLRLLRAIRLKNGLGFQYDKPTYDAIRRHRDQLKHISAERIAIELNLMLAASSRIQAIQDMEDTGVLHVILPELAALKGTPQPLRYHHEGDVFDHTLMALDTLPDDSPLFLVWSVLLHDVGKPATLGYQRDAAGLTITTNDHARVSADLAAAILRRLKFPRVEIDTITWLVAHHMSLKRIEAMRPARREAYVLDPRFPWLLELHRADASGTDPKDLSLYAHDMELLERMRLQHERSQLSTPPLLLDGHDLQTIFGMKPGKRIGELLEEIRDAQLSGQIKTKEEAVALARSLLE